MFLRQVRHRLLLGESTTTIVQLHIPLQGAKHCAQALTIKDIEG